MVRITTIWLIGLALLAGPAGAQNEDLDCGADGSLCSTTKYGFGDLPEFRKDEAPLRNLRWSDPAAFGTDLDGSSFLIAGGSLNDNDSVSCGIARAMSPFPGQVLLRELTACEPAPCDADGDTDCDADDVTFDPARFGPLCVGGTRDGLSCLIPKDTDDCPGGGVCAGGAGTCRVEIPLSDGGVTDPAESSEGFVFALSQATASTGTRTLSAATGNTFGGANLGQHCVGGDDEGAPCASDTDCGVGGTCPFSGTCRGGLRDHLTCTTAGNESPDCPVSDDPADGFLPCSSCLERNIRRKPSMATRFRLPPTHGEFDGTGDQTYIRWDHHTGNTADAAGIALMANEDTGFRLNNDDARVCCAEYEPPNNGVCAASIGPFPTYPDINEWSCGQGFGIWINEANQQPDWVFSGDASLPPFGQFYTDPTYVPPGQQTGLCENNRFQACYTQDFNAGCTGAGIYGAGEEIPCCTGAGTGTCGGECDNDTCNTDIGLCNKVALPCATDADCDLDDTCDLRQAGHRIQSFCREDAFGDLRPECCATGTYVVRGRPQERCSLLTRLPVDGDPGPDCGVLNYGIQHRDDYDCDGVADNPADLCPWYIEWDEVSDSDLDCPGPNCRGDECECGDIDGTGSVNIADILDTNSTIFGLKELRRLCDSDNTAVLASGTAPQQGCDIIDILRQNAAIFGVQATTCRHVTPGDCGDGIVGVGEDCDAGSVNDCTGPGTPHACCTGDGAGDGCNDDRGACTTICTLGGV